jgi:GABA(A) receptor-associated protein
MENAGNNIKRFLSQSKLLTSQVLKRKKLSFRDKHSFDKRKGESEKILAKYPNRIPVICEPFGDVSELDRNKYLVPDDLSIAQFLYVIRKRMLIEPEKSIYLFVKTHIMAGNMSLSSVYDKYNDEDGFLYITYGGENTFGK